MKRFFFVVLLLAACGGEKTTTERPLTTDEAAILAEVQFKNHEVGGAEFSVSAAFVNMGESIQMSGVVDWKNHHGRARVVGQGVEAGVTEVVWSENVVFEHRPNISQILAMNGRQGAYFIARPPQTSQRLVDRVIGIITALSSKERDNALLIQQKEGSLFLRADTIRDRKADVLRYGSINRFWIDSETLELLRFEGDSKSGTAPVVIDFLKFGPQTIPAPRQSTVVSVSEIQSIYDSALSAR